jgi:solute:Na+ symporter, SSS family
MIELAIVIIYFIAVIGIGLASRRKGWGLDDFFVSGRRVSTLFITGSLLATIIGGSATIGMSGLGFTRGLTGSWWILAGSAGLLVLGLFFAKKVREFGLYTLPELAGRQYDSRVALASSVLIAVAWIGVIAGQIIAAGKIFSALDIGSSTLWMVIFTFTFVSYVIWGGQNAVIRTDILQAALIYAGIFVGFGFTLWQVGGLSGLNQALPADRFSFPLSSNFGFPELASYLLLVGSTYVVGPDIYSRLFCARDTRTAKKAVLWTAVLLVPIALAITIMGMGASVLFPQISAEQALPTLILSLFPAWVGGLVLAALISAVMSSADATILSASTIITVDILARKRPAWDKEKLLKYTRIGVLALGLLSLGLALMLQGVINAMMFAYTVFTCGVILPVLVGFFRHRLRVTSNAALAAIIGGGSTALVSRLWSIKYLDLGAILVSALLLFAVSLWEKRGKTRIQS